MSYSGCIARVSCHNNDSGKQYNKYKGFKTSSKVQIFKIKVGVLFRATI